jgi:LysM repeat protein
VTVTVTAPAAAPAAPAKPTPPKTTPAKAAPAKPAPAKPAPPKSAPLRVYTVQPGDTVIAIAQRFGCSPASIFALNKLSPDDFIHPGDVLKLPAAPVKATPTKAAPVRPTPAKPATRPYVVREGDTLIGICAAHKVDLHKVLALNHLTTHSVIRPGQRLLLPAPPVTAKSNNTFLGRTYPPAVVAAADANRRALAKRTLPSRAAVKAMIISTARKRGVDPALVLAVAYQESGFNQRVVSPANAVGVMQVIPSAGRWASSLVGKDLDLLNTQDNITAGVVLLGALSDAADNEPQAIAGYYQGLASVRKNGMFDDTRRYVANIQTLKSRFAKTL